MEDQGNTEPPSGSPEIQQLGDNEMEDGDGDEKGSQTSLQMTLRKLKNHSNSSCIETEQLIRLQPNPSDPLAGLILSQGLPLLHLSYFIQAWLFLDVSKQSFDSDEDNMTNKCLFKNVTTKEWVAEPADKLLRESVNDMMWTHFYCFFLISTAEYISS